jgi:hypothetical protein
VLDRASSFADPRVIELLSEDYVPVAVDEWYHARRQDPEGELYRKIVFQREGMKPDRTTQGLYVAEPDGTLVHGWNNRNAEKLADLLQKDRARGKRTAADPKAKAEPATDARFARTPPEGGLVLDVFSRVLEAEWHEAKDEWQKVFQTARGRDHLWITAAEHRALCSGRWPETLTTRIARHHLIDNTRGEPPMWNAKEVLEARIDLEPAGAGTFRIRGRARAATADGARAYDLALGGELRVKASAVTAVDLVARGSYRGHGQFTANCAPPGPFTLGVAFALAAPGPAAQVPPQGARDLRDYLGR